MSIAVWRGSSAGGTIIHFDQSAGETMMSQTLEGSAAISMFRLTMSGPSAMFHSFALGKTPQDRQSSACARI
jgi:hypothetical protein